MIFNYFYLSLISLLLFHKIIFYHSRLIFFFYFDLINIWNDKILIN